MVSVLLVIRFCFACLLIVLGTVAQSAESPWRHSDPIDGTPPLSARLIAPINAFEGQQSIQAGLEVRLAEGWKTYWRSPGEVGMPPEIDWSQSLGIKQLELLYPKPERFTAFEIENFGYSEHTVFPLNVERTSTDDTLFLKLKANFLVCADICVPAMVDLNLLLPNGDTVIDEKSAQLISRYDAMIPDDGMRSGISVDQVSFDQDASHFVVDATARDPWINPDIFPEFGDNLPFAKPEITIDANGTSLTAVLPLKKGEVSLGDTISLTITDGDRSSTILSTVSPAAATQTASYGLGMILLFAFLGGLILNVMPCVLPVLSLKLAHAIEHRTSGDQQIRLGFLTTAAGVIASMMAIGLVTMALRSAGLAVGWGIQFQNPIFLIFMIMLIAAFAANLAGLFEFALPDSIATPLATTKTQGLGGDFLSGAFATLLATPCSAPFLGTAVGFALSGSNADIALVFLMLGMGLATPYFLVALQPKTIGLLPKPGAWMLAVKKVLALALAATAIWLLWVLATVESLTVVMAVIFLVLGLVAMISIVAQSKSAKLRHAAAVAGLAVCVLSFLTPNAVAYFQPNTERTSIATASADWQAFEREKISALVDAGHTVFVDVTADWCITCKANKFLVLDKDVVAAGLSAENVIAMQADWTKPDPKIAAYLQSYGRYGIPFNIVYGPASPEGIPLPELLSTSAVLDALKQAGK